jgi:hypothetical protein
MPPFATLEITDTLCDWIAKLNNWRCGLPLTLTPGCSQAGDALTLSLRGDPLCSNPITATIPFYSTPTIIAAIRPYDALTVDIFPGDYWIGCNKINLPILKTAFIAAGDPALSRIDAIIIDAAQNVIVLNGAPAVNPSPPGIPANNYCIARVFIRPQATIVGETSLESLVTQVPNGTARFTTLGWNGLVHQEDVNFQHDFTARVWFGQSSQPEAPFGAGDRMTYFNDLFALRMGQVTGTSWDLVNIGNYSLAFGKDSVASGVGSFSFGDTTIASGVLSWAYGYFTQATNDFAFAVGYLTQATAPHSYARGSTTIANAPYSKVSGEFNTVNGNHSTILNGYGIQLDLQYSAAIGISSVIGGVGSNNFFNVYVATTSGSISYTGVLCGRTDTLIDTGLLAAGGNAETIHNNSIISASFANGICSFTSNSSSVYLANINCSAVGGNFLALYTCTDCTLDYATTSWMQTCQNSHIGSSSYSGMTNSVGCYIGITLYSTSEFTRMDNCFDSSIINGSQIWFANNKLCNIGFYPVTPIDINKQIFYANCNKCYIPFDTQSLIQQNTFFDNNDCGYSPIKITSGPTMGLFLNNFVQCGIIGSSNCFLESVASWEFGIPDQRSHSYIIGCTGRILDQNDCVMVPALRLTGGFQSPALEVDFTVPGSIVLGLSDHYVFVTNGLGGGTVFMPFAVVSIPNKPPVPGQAYWIIQRDALVSICIHGNGFLINGLPQVWFAANATTYKAAYVKFISPATGWVCTFFND